jgi:hypothetical protein
MFDQPKPNIIEKKSPENELSQEEKEEMDKALDTEGIFDFCPRLRFESDEELKPIIDAQQKILSIGSKGLSYLEQKTIKENSFQFSQFADAIAKESDLQVIEDALAQDSVVLNHDGSAASVLNMIVERLIFTIRKNNLDDPRLDGAASKIIAILSKNIGNVSARLDYLRSLALTGTKKAKDYFSDKVELKSKFQKYIDDVNNHVEYSFHRSRFETWEDILKEREPRSQYRNYDIDEDMWQEEDDWRDERSLRRDEEFDKYDEFNEYGEFSFDYGKDYLDEKTKENVRQTEEMTGSLNLPEIIVPIAKLYIFNRFQENPNQENLDRSIRMIEKLAEAEKKHENIEILPTVGIEIECHNEMMNGEKIASLNALGVSNCAEGIHFWEINPNFSYSALVQSRYLQEIVRAGFIPLHPDGKNKKNISNDHLLSLHINLGIPVEIKNRKSFKKMEYILSDALNYAFTSSNRIVFRKTNSSVSFKDGEISKKIKYSEKNSQEKKKNWKKNEEDRLFEFSRLELRASEFKDYRTYLMLESAQRIGAMLFSSVKANEKEKMSQQEIALAKLWKSFKIDYFEIMKKNNIRVMNAVDKDFEQAASFADKPELKKECRELIYKYSRAVGNLLEVRKKAPESLAA